MPFGCQNEESPRLLHSLFGFLVVGLNCLADRFGIALRILGKRLHDQEINVAAQFDVGSATRHVGGNRHCAGLARISNDLGFLLVLTRVQDVVRDPIFCQHLADHLGFLDRGCAHKHRLAFGIGRLDFLDDAVIFLARCPVDLIMIICPRNRLVGGHFDNAKTVNFLEFIGLGGRCPGHACQLVVEAEIVLERHLCERHVLRLDLYALLGFNRLVQTIRQAPSCHHTAREFIDQHNLTVAHDVILVLGEQLVGAQALVYVMDNGGTFRIVEGLVFLEMTGHLQQTLQGLVALIGKGHVPGFLVDRVMLIVQLGDDFIDCDIELGPVLCGPGDDQRRAGLVNQDRVHLVDNREVMVALRHI